MNLPSKEKTGKKPKVKTVSPFLSLQMGKRVVCPRCGNDWHFYEVAEDVMLTTRYIQNADGSFTPQSDESSILGEVKFFCGECNTDLTQFHNRLMEMLF